MPKISRAKAKDLIRAFIKDKSPSLNQIVKKISNGTQTEDANYTWFSLQDLKDYIKYLDDSNQGITGVNIYFGQYNDPKSSDYGVSTSVFIPTKKKKISDPDSKLNSVENQDLEALNLGGVGIPPGGQ